MERIVYFPKTVEENGSETFAHLVVLGCKRGFSVGHGHTVILISACRLKRLTQNTRDPKETYGLLYTKKVLWNMSGQFTDLYNSIQIILSVPPASPFYKVRIQIEE